MRNTLENYTHMIEGGNTIRIMAPAESGRVHLEGTGTIRAFVSTNGKDYKEITHPEAFSSGVCEAPIDAYVGDYIKFTATTLTKVEVNWNC